MLAVSEHIRKLKRKQKLKLRFYDRLDEEIASTSEKFMMLCQLKCDKRQKDRDIMMAPLRAKLAAERKAAKAAKPASKKPPKMNQWGLAKVTSNDPNQP